MIFSPEGTMNAKAYAAIVIDNSRIEGADKLRCAAEVADTIIKEASDKAGTLHQFSAKIAVWKEAVALWKEVVNTVRMEETSHPIFTNLFGAVLTVCAPELFRILVQYQVLVGYRLNQKESMLVNEERIQSIIK
jgi:hypothetical protein